MTKIETNSRVSLAGTNETRICDVYQDAAGRTWVRWDDDMIECHQAPTGWVVRE